MLTINALRTEKAKLLELEVFLQNHGEMILEQLDKSIDAIEEYKRDPKFLEKLCAKRQDITAKIASIKQIAKTIT